MNLKQQLAEALERVQAQNPLIHQLTNFVTANDCANVTLALGASPVMADDPGEAAEMSSAADALVLNIGTLDHSRLPAMLLAGQAAAEKGIPIIFDPVGVGATALRSAAAQEIIRCLPLSVIRGNRSEIKQLAGFASVIKGVDAQEDDDEEINDLPAIARDLAQRLDCVVCVTGRQDLVVDKHRLCLISNGHPFLSRITGTGCMASALIASCCAVCGDPFLGAITGLTVMGVAGETAQATLREGEGLGTFRLRLFDAISTLTPETFAAKARLTTTIKEAPSCRYAN
ncbi:hydroxyethylthiazole kinase [Azotosporobacter soli]|uniref:hydroxyethylthiazole kinase n=1 Tax=Azotosporobacter soli TaxID=3055040 RepID=UPI0031FF2CEE